MRVINMPEGLIKNARDLYAKSEAVRSLLRGLIAEESRNQTDWVNVWNAVDTEAKNQGVIREDGEMYNFDVALNKFNIIRK